MLTERPSQAVSDSLGLTDDAGPQLYFTEIESTLSSSTLDRKLHNVARTTATCKVGEDKFRDVILSEHFGQVRNQTVVLQRQYVVYIAATEPGMLHIAVLLMLSSVAKVCTGALRVVGEE